jgi:uncharacterized YigZ family protein
MIYEDTFKTISGQSEGIFKEKGSRFISKAFPVNSDDDIRQHLAGLKNEFHDARHHCYAYILGAEKTVFRMNDDGEPSGTAGRPIYNEIRSKGLTNTLVVVIRYFGGIKLGVRGLINAYTYATQLALESAQVIEKTVGDVYELKFDYVLMNKIMRILKDEDTNIHEQSFNLTCSLQFFVRQSSSNKILQKFGEINGLEINYIRTISE